MKYARVGGALYLIIIIAGIFGGLFVRGKLVVPGDVATTASKHYSITNAVATGYWRRPDHATL